MTPTCPTDMPLTLSPSTMSTLIPPTSALHRWTEEMRSVAACQHRADEVDWQLQGHAVLLECHLMEEVPTLLDQVAAMSGMPLRVFSPVEVVEDFLRWIGELPANEPALVYLMPGSWMDPTTPGGELELLTDSVSACTDAFLRALQKVIEGLGTRPVVLITAARSFEQLNPCLRQVGYFDRRIRVPDGSAQALVSDFLHELGHGLADESLLGKPDRLGALLRAVLPDRRRRNLTVLALKRLSRREQRPIRFADVVQMATQGTTEDDPVPTDDHARYRTAVHEAGHALVSHLDSSAMSAPTMCTAIKSRDCHGQVVASFEAIETRGDDLTVGHIRHKIRVQLAGRAAEMLVLGVAATSATGSSSDLYEATCLAMHMVADWGISPDFDSNDSQAANLAVVINGCNPAENPRLVRMARQILQTEFQKTTEILCKHRIYLDRIVQALCQQDVLTQEDFDRLWAECSSSHTRGIVDRECTDEALG